MERCTGIWQLSPGMLKVLRLYVVHDLPCSLIAVLLGRSYHTVQRQRIHLYNRLQVNCKAGAMRWYEAHKHELYVPPPQRRSDAPALV